MLSVLIELCNEDGLFVWMDGTDVEEESQVPVFVLGVMWAGRY